MEEGGGEGRGGEGGGEAKGKEDGKGGEGLKMQTICH